MKKTMKRVVAVVGIVLVLLIAALLIFPDQMVLTAVNKAGPKALGVEVTLDDADFTLIQGRAELKGLLVGNPEGFNARSLCEVDKITVKLDPATLLSDTLVIEEVLIEKPVFTYQKGLTTSNLGKLLDNLEGDKKSEKDKEKKEDKGSKKKVIINKLTIDGAMVKLAIRGIPAGAPLPLPKIELTDIGKDSGGTSIKDAVAMVFKAVFGSIKVVLTGSLKVVTKSGELVIDGATGTVKAAGGAVKAVGGGAMSAVKGIGNLITGKDEEDTEDEEPEEPEEPEQTD